MSVHIDIHYRGELICEATHGPSQKTLLTDAPTDNGGQGSEFSPTDLLATAVGTCMLTLMDLTAKKHGLDLKDTKVSVVKEMVSSPLRRIGRLLIKVTFAQPIPEDLRSRLEKAALSCPVKQSLHPEVKLDIEFIY